MGKQNQANAYLKIVYTSSEISHKQEILCKITSVRNATLFATLKRKLTALFRSLLCIM